MERSKSWRHLVMVLSVAVASSTICLVDVLPEDPKVGFLHPKRCSGDIEFPYTFLAKFFKLKKNRDWVRLHLHEYYLKDIKLRVCEKNFWIHHDSRTLTEKTTYNNCQDYQPNDCYGIQGNHYKDSSSSVILINDHLRRRPFNYSIYVNITMTTKPEFLHLPHDPYSGREMFNITYELWEDGETIKVPEMSRYTYLQHCNYNGFPELHRKNNGVYYQFECHCLANTSGDTCQWGNACPASTPTPLCNYHGHCQYYRGEEVCICDEYFGQYCQYPESSAPIHSKNCDGQLECHHLCQMASGIPKCICELGYMLINKTHCHPMEDSWEVTVKVQNYHGNESLKEKTYKFLQEAGLEDINITPLPTRPREEKIHFVVKDESFGLLPNTTMWESTFNSSITCQNVLWIGPVKKEIQHPFLILTCDVYGLLPLKITWYKDQHRIYNINVTSCIDQRVKDGIFTVFYHETLRAKACSVELWVKWHDSLVDWGSYTCQVTSDHKAWGSNTCQAPGGHRTVNRTIQAELDHPLQIEISPSVTRIEKNSNASLRCISKSDSDGGKYYSFTWKINPEDGVGHYYFNNSNWNMSDIYIYNIQSGQNAETVCPENFLGKAKRKCLLEDQNATWSVPDFSSCTYIPLLDILENPELVLQSRGYPITIQNVTELAKQLQQHLENRNTSFLPGEAAVALTTLKRLFTPVNMLVDAEMFLCIVVQVMRKMDAPRPTDMWELYDLIKLYIKSSLEYHPPRTSNFSSLEMTARFETVNPYENIMLESPSPSEDQGAGSFRVEVRAMRKLYIGAVMYLQPGNFLMGVTMQARRNLSNIPVQLVDTPVVELKAVNLVNQVLSPLNQTFISHLSFMGYPAHTQASSDNNTENITWVRKCGVGTLENTILMWDLSACTVESQEEGQDTIICECHGQGLFGQLMVPTHVTQPPLPDPDWNKTLVIGISCAVMVLLILLCLLLVSSGKLEISVECCLNLRICGGCCLKRKRCRETPSTQIGDVNKNKETIELMPQHTQGTLQERGDSYTNMTTNPEHSHQVCTCLKNLHTYVNLQVNSVPLSQHDKVLTVSEYISPELANQAFNIENYVPPLTTQDQPNEYLFMK